MNGFQMAMHDIKQMWSSGIMRRSVLGLMVLPLMYSFIYLWAFWNPTDFVSRLPLAVINQDKGMLQGGKQVNLGSDLTKELLNDTKTHWREVTPEEGDQGIRRLQYFLVLTIPADFTERAYSAGTPQPRASQLTYQVNEGANMLGVKVVRSIMDQVSYKLEQQMTAKYLRVLFDQILNGGEGLKKAADGASQLADGTKKAQDGANALRDGLKQTQDGMVPLSEGLTKLLNGANQLENGIIRLDAVIGVGTAGVSKLPEQLKQLLQPVNQLAAEADKLQGVMNQTSQTVKSSLNALDNVGASLDDTNKRIDELQKDWDASAGARLQQQKAQLDGALADLIALGEQISQVSGNERFRAAVDKLQQANAQRLLLEQDRRDVSASLGRLRANLTQANAQLRQGRDQLDAQLAQLQSGLTAMQSAVRASLDQLNRNAQLIEDISGRLGQLADGVKQLQQGSTALVEGLNAFQSGFQQLRDGNTRLYDGSVQLASGLQDIHAGQAELAAKLGEAAGMAAQDGQADARIDTITYPVKMTEQNLHPVPNNGTGFAPYFIALSLWVGSLVLFFVIDLNKVVALPKRPISYLTNKYLALASVSVFQSVLSVFILHNGLGIPTVLPAIHMYGFALLLGLTFTAILFMLISVLGSDVGRFVAIVVLMLQLTSSSGSYPVELESRFFQFIHPLLPMTYAVEGFRELISIGEASVIARDAFILALYGLAALALLYLVKRKRIIKELQETHAVS
ncbi:YhgE/Pip domain-containing protein [Paenibacillus filicis]|uniref:YhgE/Pip domain-containing protein n=1 Tax=Paenibacillus gyeongsangnamensis TaxID=3388067 RepID=A0ABT4Q6X5_9BACL|nr:YhgE/Pip domain-containing protein [Paenibacillus filicis]MCZ8512579.1 YhgE/Pip domain-containing protein [Paenibacillus filicis]